MLYLLENAASLPKDFAEKAAPLLSEQRLGRALSYRFAADRALSAAAYLLLRLALFEQFAIEEKQRFGHGLYGKPFLADHPGIHFSLSHCKSAVCCGLSHRPIGTDVEDVIPVPMGLAERVLSPLELSHMRRACDPNRAFCECWVMKESCLKRSGVGLGADLCAMEARALHEVRLLPSPPGYCLAVAGEAGPLRRVDVAELTALPCTTTI